MNNLEEKELRAINGGMEYWEWMPYDPAKGNAGAGITVAAINGVVAVQRGIAWVVNLF
ncbi:MAG: hypothetical protein N4A59_10010 [Marinifilum sp.]|jgi:hypothetical protein|nr:hypothetical protein [Marinifilum sp.]